MSKITGYATERTKPFPLTELDFSRNHITSAGIGALVQFARTQGADATRIDLSRNALDDKAATDEVTRLVKNYSSLSANQFISELVLTGNNIGRVGASTALPRHPCARLLARASPAPTRPHPPPRRVLMLRAGATKLIQYAHWERDRYKAEANPPAPLKLDLSDNCITEPAGASSARAAARSTRRVPSAAPPSRCSLSVRTRVQN
jgi:hypothetical protein